jgi:hypothetical protein
MQAKMVLAGVEVTEEDELSGISFQRSALPVRLKADR